MLRTLFLLQMLGWAAIAAAQQPADAPGSSDHPLITRFPNTWIRFYEQQAFAAYRLRTGPVAAANGELAAFQPLEGKMTRIVYQHARGSSSLEIFRNYLAALSQAGFEAVWSCEAAGCGGRFGYSYPADNAPHIRSYSQNQRYAASRLDGEDGTVHVAVYAVETNDGPVTRLDIVEQAPLQLGQIQVTAAQMRQDLSGKGRAVLYGLHFGTNESALRPESRPALDEIAILLRNDPSLKVFVVGHTDQDGGLEFNLQLSLRRAEAVVQTLTADYGIAPERLAAKGLAYLSPVASSSTEAGKARNRRVELVEQ
ncbi:MAG: OmpA family protein [Bacteroidia bacterium]|nr:OmpA family protein [Bacteroidia bacterium]